MESANLHATYDSEYFRRISAWSGQNVYADQLTRLLELMGMSADDRVLDIGCGTGAAMREIKRLKGSSVIGVEPHLDAAPYLSDLEVHDGIAESLPFSDGEFDCVLMSHVIGHVRSPASALAEAFRVLKSGGRLGVITPNARFVKVLRPLNFLGLIPHRKDGTILRYYHLPQLRQELEETGFTLKHCTFLGVLPFGSAWLSRFEMARSFRQRLIAVALKAS